ncbi:hypothetical protein Nizo2726_1790 [Lactiplantibacillus plantarum]|nr:hypothetical protein Nizo2726_1790 [Lactiplantibacillus plantarum]KZU61731.1 hypothetical protein Nizo2830_2703 [Lactiplantibacillus plantarum]KZU64104.1 hypothetical protein Nizo2831_2138 [Lactiplantibacillus plantarum]
MRTKSGFKAMNTLYQFHSTAGSLKLKIAIKQIQNYSAFGYCF